MDFYIDFFDNIIVGNEYITLDAAYMSFKCWVKEFFPEHEVPCKREFKQQLTYRFGPCEKNKWKLTFIHDDLY